MATIQNRSPLVVTVPRKAELRREFRHDHLDDAERYMRELVAGAHTGGKPVQPKIEQGNYAWEVRFRDKGFPDINLTFPTEQAARDFEQLVRVERKQGIVKDSLQGATNSRARKLPLRAELTELLARRKR